MLKRDTITATQYARNAIFSGLMPNKIAEMFPELWVDEDEEEGKNLTQNADAYKEVYNYIAGNKLENGDTAGAKEYYTKYLELDPTNEALRKFVEGLK